MRGSTTDEARPEFDQVVRRVQDISTLPHVAIQVMEVTNDPGAGAVDLKDPMESDAALSAKGSTFSVTIAARCRSTRRSAMVDGPSQVATPRRPPPETVTGPRITLDCRILLAEDSPDLQRLA